jgi:hypothetical protein
MAACPYTVVPSNTPEVGKATTYRIVPPIKYPCSAQWTVNGMAAAPGDSGSLHVSGIEGDGKITVRPLSDPAAGTITVTISCGGERPCGPTVITIDVSEAGTQPLWGNMIATLLLPLTLGLLLLLLFALLLALMWAMVLNDRRPLERVRDILHDLYDYFPDWVQRLVPNWPF